MILRIFILFIMSLSASSFAFATACAGKWKAWLATFLLRHTKDQQELDSPVCSVGHE